MPKKGLSAARDLKHRTPTEIPRWGGGIFLGMWKPLKKTDHSQVFLGIVLHTDVAAPERIHRLIQDQHVYSPPCDA